MTWEIFKFELKYRWKRPATYIYFAIMFLLPFFAVISDNIQIGGGAGQIKDNAPHNIANMFLILSALPGLLLAAGIMGVPVIRDYEHKTESLFFTTPIHKFQYLTGRFLGSFLTAVFVFSAMVWGAALGHLSPWAEADKLLPFNFSYYWAPFIKLVIPNLFIMSGVFFAGGALSKKLIVVFTQGIVLLVGYLVSLQIITDLESQNLASLLDPFALGTHNFATQYWTVAEKNSLTTTLEGALLTNRLIWIGVSILALIITYVFFNFSSPKQKVKKKKKDEAPTVAKLSAAKTIIPKVTQHDGMGTYFNQMFGMSWFYFKWIFKQIPFRAMIFAGMVVLLTDAQYWGKYYDVFKLPTTYSMLELIGTFNLFFMIILVAYSGELIWKERDVKMNLIYDALPYPNFVTLAGKYLAMTYMFIFILLFLMLTGIGVQLSRGYGDIQIGLYLRSLFGTTLPFLLLFTFLGFLFQSLVNHKFVGHAVFVLFFIVTIVLNELGFEHRMFDFANTGLGQFSDMNGYGHYVPRFSWFNVYWFGFTGLLFGIALLMSTRGAETAFLARLKKSRLRLSTPLISFMLLSMMTFVGSGCFIYYNTNIKNKYTNSDDNEKSQADYEKTLKKYADIAQPRITGVNLEVDIYPEDRNFEARGTYQLKNKTNETISEIHVQYYPDEQLTHQIKFKEVATVKESFDEFKYHIYELKTPMAPGDSMSMDFVTKFNTSGFVEGSSNTEVLNNGTFFNNSYFPAFGYSRSMEIGNDDDRKKYDLPERERQRERHDSIGLHQHLITDDADRIDLEVILSTSPDQIAIAPGYLQKEWEKDGRRYFHYKMDDPILAFYSIVSARYEVMRDIWTSKTGDKVNLEIYYHKGHELNLDRLMRGMKKSLDYFTENFSPYQYRQLRIMEFPRYRSFAQSFSNTVPFSEEMGFILDIKEDDVDMPFYVTAHEVGHQWWAHQVTEANVKGNAMLSETMAQYSALMVMKHSFSTIVMQKFLKQEMNSYLRGRSGEQKKEQPLELVEQQGYIHYRKGAVVMYALQDYIGEDSVNMALKRCIKDWAFREDQYITSADLLEYFREVTPDSLQYLIKDMFETITLFENRTKEATYEKVGNQFKVELDISAIKYRADSLGNETSIPVDDWIDIGVLGEDENGKEKLLYLEKHKINAKEMKFEIMVNEKPTKAGIDPINKLIDRNPDDNRIRVALKKESS